MFLSTPPVWVATREQGQYQGPVQFLSTPPVWVATEAVRVGGERLNVSIHATRVGGDVRQGSLTLSAPMFLSTPPVWVATRKSFAQTATSFVSIHATRVGGDRGGSRSFRCATCFYPRHPCGWRRRSRRAYRARRSSFYPRHPCGWRLSVSKWADSYTMFLSTPPVWVATGTPPAGPYQLRVSIHATRVGGDAGFDSGQCVCSRFLSTPPVWVATRRAPRRTTWRASFYPRHPCGWRRLI